MKEKRSRHPDLDMSKFPNNKIWEMHPDEPSKAFDYFKYYRDLGVTRGIVRVAEHFGLSHQAIAYYSSPCEWVKRVRAYESYLDAEISKAKLQAIKELTKKQIHNLGLATTALMIPIKKLLKQSHNGTLDLKMDKLEGLELLEVVNKYITTLAKVTGVERMVHEQPNEIIKNEYGEGAPQAIVVIGPDASNERVNKYLAERNRKLADNEPDDI